MRPQGGRGSSFVSTMLKKTEVLVNMGLLTLSKPLTARPQFSQLLGASDWGSNGKRPATQFHAIEKESAF